MTLAPKVHRHAAAWCLVAVLVCWSVTAAPVLAADHGAEVQALLDKVQQATGSDRWNQYTALVNAIQTYPDDANPKIKEALPKAGPAARVVLCAALILAEMPENGETLPNAKAGADELLKLLENDIDKFSPEEWLELSGVLIRSKLHLAAEKTVGERLKALAGGKNVPAALLAGRVLNQWKVPIQKEGLVVPQLSSKDVNLRHLATLLACEMDLYAENDARQAVMKNLKEMAGYPTTLGDYAASLQRTIALEYRLTGVMEPRHTPGKNGFVREDGEQLLRDITDKITVAYADESKIDLKHLYEQAAIGMVNALDPFSAYLTEQDVIDSNERLDGKYFGIGAYVGMRDALFTIIAPMYGSPADKAGLKSMDRILKVDGVEIKDMTMTAIIKRLKGPVDTPVKITYWRRGFSEPRELTVKRAEIVVPSVISGVLPGDIGYLRLTNFGVDTGADLQKAIAAMKKDHEIRGFILDLRNNPGGLLNTAVTVSNLFLDKGKLIVFSQGRPMVYPKTEYFSENDPVVQEPVAVLVNTGSASASEIVSGSLHDYDRAVLVGEKTFGKGSVQQTFRMPAMGDATELRMTIAKYYLPKGECIHEKGIEPDVPIEMPIIPGWKYDDFDKIAEAKAVEKYFEQYFADNQATFEKLAVYDGGDASQYPGFQAFFDSLKTHLTTDDVRLLLRAEARRRYQDTHHAEFAFDYQEDVQLRRAILEMDRRNKDLDLRKIEVYKNLDKQFEEKDKNPELANLLNSQKQPTASAAPTGNADAKANAGATPPAVPDPAPTAPAAIPGN